MAKQKTVKMWKSSPNQKFSGGSFKKSVKEKGFVCPTCGYAAFRMAKLSHCPLCVICARCGKGIRNCKCKEGE